MTWIGFTAHAQDTVYWEANFDTPSTSNLLFDVPNTPQSWQIGSSHKPFMFQNGSIGSRCLMTDTADTLIPQDTLVASISLLGLLDAWSGYTSPLDVYFEQNYDLQDGDSVSIEFYVSGDSNRVDILTDSSYLIQIGGVVPINLNYESNNSQGWLSSRFGLNLVEFSYAFNIWHFDTFNLTFTLFTSANNANPSGWAIDNIRMKQGIVTSIDELGNFSQAAIYPSPAQEWVRVVLPDNVPTERVNYGIYDMLGSLKQEGTVSRDGLIGFDETLSAGVYVIELESQQKKYTSKFIVSSN